MTPTSASAPEVLADTSVAVALVVADHQHHDRTVDAIGGRRVGLSGHAVFETFSVLTRLPPPARRPPSVVVALLRDNFPENRFLSPDHTAALPGVLAAAGIAGGAVYDALVAAAAVEHGLDLVTRDRRALATYRALGADLEVVAG